MSKSKTAHSDFRGYAAPDVQSSKIKHNNSVTDICQENPRQTFLILMCIFSSFTFEPRCNPNEPKSAIHVRPYKPLDFIYDMFSFRHFFILPNSLCTENELRHLVIYVTKKIPSKSRGI